MALNSNSLAPALGISGKNVALAVTAQVLKRKLLLVGSYDPAILTLTDNVPVRVFSAEDVGAQTGFGFMLHRMAIRAFKSAPGVEIYIAPQSEEGGSAQSVGSLLVDVASGVAGTFSLYIAGVLISVNLTAADTAAQTATKIIDAINADTDLPVTALVNVTPEQLDITAKSGGEYWGDNITTETNINGESDPGSLAYAIVDLTAGVGTPDIDDVLNELGTGSAQNADFYTDLVHGYGAVTAVLDKLQAYNGIANDLVGNFDDLVHKPFRSVNGDTQAGSGGLSTLIAFGNGRKETDRTSGIIPVPGSAWHPVELGCLAMGYMATQNDNKAELSYKGQILEGVDPGVMADRWTNDYATGRDAAAKAGISCTIVQSGVVKMQNALTFYHPVSIPQDSNAYRNMRNISLVQNIFNTVEALFLQEQWQQFVVVVDLAHVSSVQNRASAKSPSSVKDAWIALFTAFAAKAWIASLAFSLEQLKDANSVVIRTGGNGFNSFPKFIFSGDGDIVTNDIFYDTSFAILNQ